MESDTNPPRVINLAASVSLGPLGASVRVDTVPVNDDGSNWWQQIPWGRSVELLDWLTRKGCELLDSLGTSMSRSCRSFSVPGWN